MKLFIAGTDTNVGKTYISLSLINHYKAQGNTVIALKPIATGINQEGYNDDALLFWQNSSLKLSYNEINPFCFKEPISPNISAQLEYKDINAKLVANKLQPTLENNADIFIIEGTGGWYTPINSQETMADLAKELGFSIILVIGIRLGCLNHAILTYQAIKAAGLQIFGWIGNIIDPNMQAIEENIITLKTLIEAPCLDVIYYKE